MRSDPDTAVAVEKAALDNCDPILWLLWEPSYDESDSGWSAGSNHSPESCIIISIAELCSRDPSVCPVVQGSLGVSVYR